jgi:hypothetical protein
MGNNPGGGKHRCERADLSVWYCCILERGVVSSGQAVQAMRADVQKLQPTPFWCRCKPLGKRRF